MNELGLLAFASVFFVVGYVFGRTSPARRRVEPAEPGPPVPALNEPLPAIHVADAWYCQRCESELLPPVPRATPFGTRQHLSCPQCRGRTVLDA